MDVTSLPNDKETCPDDKVTQGKTMSPSRVDKEGPRSTLKHWIMPLQVKGVQNNSITTAEETNDSLKKPKGKKGGKTPEPSPNCPTVAKPRSLTEGVAARMIPQGKQDEVGKEGMDVEDGTERMELKEVEDSKKEAGGKPLPLEGLGFLASGIFPEITDGTEPQLGPASNLYNGRNVLKHLVISYGGWFTLNINKQTRFLIVGSKLSKKTIEKAHLANAGIISYTTLEGMIAGTVGPEFASFEPQPNLREYLQGNNHPDIHCGKTFTAVEAPPGAEETAAAKVSFTGVKIRKSKEVSTPEGTSEHPNLVVGSKLLGKKGVLDVSHLGKNRCKYVNMVHANMQVPHRDVKNLVMELIFMGLDTLRAEVKSVCFLHPNDPNQKAKARKDMPAKF
jgi:hypothetical protein